MQDMRLQDVQLQFKLQGSFCACRLIQAFAVSWLVGLST
jgi:hypothetical protein